MLGMKHVRSILALVSYSLLLGGHDVSTPHSHAPQSLWHWDATGQGSGSYYVYIICSLCMYHVVCNIWCVYCIMCMYHVYRSSVAPCDVCIKCRYHVMYVWRMYVSCDVCIMCCMYHVMYVLCVYVMYALKRGGGVSKDSHDSCVWWASSCSRSL